jgi:hypothetical protein
MVDHWFRHRLDDVIGHGLGPGARRFRLLFFSNSTPPIVGNFNALLARAERQLRWARHTKGVEFRQSAGICQLGNEPTVTRIKRPVKETFGGDITWAEYAPCLENLHHVLISPNTASQCPQSRQCEANWRYENLAVYDASMSEWAADPSLPMETG